MDPIILTFFRAMMVQVMDLILTFLQAMIVLLVHLKFPVKVVASTTRELGLSLDRQVLVMDPIILTFFRAMMVQVMDLILTFLRAMIVHLILLVKYRGKVVASTNRDLVTSSDMMVSVMEICLATDHSSIALVDRRSVRALV